MTDTQKHLLWSILRTALALGVATFLEVLLANLSPGLGAFVSEPQMFGVTLAILTLVIRGLITATRGIAGVK